MDKYPEDPTSLTFVEYDSLDRDSVEAFLRDLGADQGVISIAGRHVRHANVRDVMARFTEYAKSNPRVVLGALSALIAGGAAAAGAAVKSRKSSSSKRTAAAKKSASSGKRSSKATKSSKSSKSSRSSKAAKRTLIEPHAGDKRYIRRDARGRIKESVDVGRSLSADRRSKSKTKSKPGQGDKGDR